MGKVRLALLDFCTEARGRVASDRQAMLRGDFIFHLAHTQLPLEDWVACCGQRRVAVELLFESGRCGTGRRRGQRQVKVLAGQGQHLRSSGQTWIC
jgi:hypothetical protein